MRHLDVDCTARSFEDLPKTQGWGQKIDVAAVGSQIDSDIKLITQFVDELKLNEKVYITD